MNRDDDCYLSFEEAHQKYFEKVYALILRWVGNADEANDLTQDTFLNAHQAWDRPRGDVPAHVWLHQIAINNCKQWFKQKDNQ